MTLTGNRDTADRVWAALLSVAVAVAAVVLSSGEPSPSLWEDLAIAAGARPAMPTCNSVWLCIASMSLRVLPGGLGYKVLWLMGPLALGVMAYLFSGIVQSQLPEFLRRMLAERRSRALIRRFAILPITLLFCLSEPIWRLGLFFTPDTLHVLLAMTGLFGLVRFRRLKLRNYAIWSFAALGVLAAEEPIGFGLLVAAVGVMTRDALTLRDSTDTFRVTNTALYVFLQRFLTILALVAIAAVVFLAAAFFLLNDGYSAATEVREHQVIVDFLMAWVRRVPAIATKGGWIYFFGLGVVPLVIILIPIRRALDIEKILDYRLALCYIGAGSLSFLQLSNFPVFWLWQSNRGNDAVGSSLLLAITMTCCAYALALALCVLLVEVFYRHYERFEQALFADAPDGFVEALDRQVKRGALKVTWLVAVCVPCVLVALSAMRRPNPVERDMYRAVGDFVRLAADDCEGSPVAITDGAADAALELELFRRGQKGFKALSMMGGRTSRESYLRRRGEQEDTEDWISLGISTAGALRDWVRTKSDRAKRLTVQIGFELWRHERLPMPEMGATAGRTDGIDPERRAALAASARGLGERMLVLAGQGAPNVTSDAALRRKWNFALWRLARAARMRSDEADRAGDLQRAGVETALADRLDDVNLAYKDIRSRTEWVPRQVQLRFTPREGLRFALQQADFTLASTYARQVLATEPDDFQANFAMGMYYVAGEQFTRAMQHLERAHAARPREPSTINNLATVEMQMGRLDKALEHAEAALKIAPDVPEIKRTFERVKREIEKATTANEQGRIP